ncbi:cytochrome oxidase assembly protein [Arenimonas soli]|uniref:Cytochrome oxidase assembly protein n=1 Tax=Arenimonas soli TaxID=2269504 RepID=A0ABQ1HP25_9GAMM|nr:COX15/CtaA family protein [Arenimonas soli]GGA82914.1 cytochrome oxidase assembly protein [Arenimonas soli]
MIAPSRHFHRLAWAAVLLALVVIVFGGFVRLSNAGLSCPDWPTCYGKATWPTQDHEIAAANAGYERIVEVSKAWREQFHRHIAALLGVLVLALALLAARKRKGGVGSVLAASALVGLSIPVYMGVGMAPNHELSVALWLAGELILLVQALRWSNVDAARLSTLLLMVIVFQAVLGMWTVIWLVKPVIVMAHLMGGLLTLSLLTWLAWKTTPWGPLVSAEAPRLRRLLWIGLVLLVVQIALGGWTSANYAALACGTDYPTCLGQWWPEQDYREGFILWRGIGVDYEGGVLDGPARVAIQMAHRLMAILVAGHLLVVAFKLLRSTGLRYSGGLLLVLLCAQVALGISNIVLGLPLWVAVAHNAGAAMLLFTVVGLLARLRAPE